MLSRRLQNQSLCLQNDLCTWDYNGIGLEYQVRYIEKSSSETSLNVVVVFVKFDIICVRYSQILAGPAFIWVFAITAIILGETFLLYTDVR